MIDYAYNIHELQKQYGDSFYVLRSDKFKNNYSELLDSFKNIYSKFNIAYSYKTNYIPVLCKLVDELGGYAEVVSDMEYQLAKTIGVAAHKIIFNGPYKCREAVKELLGDGGIVNIDSIVDFELIKDIAKESDFNKKINVAIRCNFDIKDGVISRFGVDVDSPEFEEILSYCNNSDNIFLCGVHLHFADRSLQAWKGRVEGLKNILLKYFKTPPKYIDLGGGLFGKMPASLKKQFNSDIPSYQEYASVVAPLFVELYGSLSYEEQPNVFIEPGSALVGDVMDFVARVVSIKRVRDKYIATLTGSIYNINPTLNKKNPPIKVIQANHTESIIYKALDFGGYTCIESDYLYKNFNGSLAIGDFIVFGNVGSYSIVLKPPFILPNFPIIDLSTSGIKLVKRQENFDDIFNTFVF